MTSKYAYALLSAGAVLCAAAVAEAVPLAGEEVTITSSFNGGTVQSTTVVVGTPTAFGDTLEVVHDTFEWMESGDFVDVHATNAAVRPETLSVFFVDTGTGSPRFGAGDTIEITLQLPTGLAFGGTTLISAISVQVPDGVSIAGSTLSFTMTALDQINSIAGPGTEVTGLARVRFDVLAVPEPATAGLFGLAAAGLVMARRRRPARAADRPGTGA